MDLANDASMPKGALARFLANVWPQTSPAESEHQRRKKVAIRSGQLAMMVMVTAAIAGTIGADFKHFTLGRGVILGVTGLVYMVWNLYGTRNAVRLALWEAGTPPPLLRSPKAKNSAFLYFGIQLGLAGLIDFVGDLGHGTSLLWLVLLPPIAHSVILLGRTGVITVGTLCTLILLVNVVRWHDWAMVPTALVEFLFAVLFTLIFTILMVSSEKARGEVQRLAAQLGDANRKLRDYAVQVEELAATRERNRLAREIHDSLGHYLTVVNVQLQAAHALYDCDPTRARDALNKAQSLTQSGLTEIRRSVAALRASPLENKPLAEALQLVADESRASGLGTKVVVLGEVRALSPQVELTLYRACQEGFTNIQKHAKATQAQLILDFRTPERISLRLTDNGLGMALSDSTHGFGIMGLRERAQLLGGELRTHSEPGKGFTLQLEVPS